MFGTAKYPSSYIEPRRAPVVLPPLIGTEDVVVVEPDCRIEQRTCNPGLHGGAPHPERRCRFRSTIRSEVGKFRLRPP